MTGLDIYSLKDESFWGTFFMDKMGNLGVISFEVRSQEKSVILALIYIKPCAVTGGDRSYQIWTRLDHCLTLPQGGQIQAKPCPQS